MLDVYRIRCFIFLYTILDSLTFYILLLSIILVEHKKFCLNQSISISTLREALESVVFLEQNQTNCHIFMTLL